jgi:hypothetical protein
VEDRFAEAYLLRIPFPNKCDPLDGIRAARFFRSLESPRRRAVTISLCDETKVRFEGKRDELRRPGFALHNLTLLKPPRLILLNSFVWFQDCGKWVIVRDVYGDCPATKHPDTKVHKERPLRAFVSWCLGGETLLNTLLQHHEMVNSLALQVLYVVEQHCLVPLRIHFLIDLAHDSSGVDHEAGPVPVHRTLVLGLADATGLEQLGVGIRE